MTTNDLANAAEVIKQNFSAEDILYAQAVSVASVLVEMKLLRASVEDVVDGLFERFEKMVPRDHLEDKAKEAIEAGVRLGLFERIDEDHICLSVEGNLIGTDWHYRIQND